MLIRTLFVLMTVFLSTSAHAQPACTPERLKELRVELEGIQAIRQMGGLNAARGVCTIVRSLETVVAVYGGDVVKKLDEYLEKAGFKIPANVASNMCKDLHRFGDDLLVGKRAEVVKAELQACGE